MSAPAGHVDLLTAIMHEMGHKLGLDDSYQERIATISCTAT